MVEQIFEISFLFKVLLAIFKPSAIQCVRLTEHQIIFCYLDKTEAFFSVDTTTVDLHKSIWGVLAIFSSNEDRKTIIGLPTEKTNLLINNIIAFQQQHIEQEKQSKLEKERVRRIAQEKQEIEENSKGIAEVISKLKQRGLFDQYVSRSQYAYIQSEINPFLHYIKKIYSNEFLIPVEEKHRQLLSPLNGLLSNSASFSKTILDEYNEQVVERELRDFEEYFNTIENKPLTYKQSLACVINEDGNLVVAGAGTGKTSTIVGKCGYLLKKKIVPPSQILLLAYGKEASKEMDERINERIGDVEIRSSTFHSLGLSIIGQVDGKKPSIAKHAENDHLRGAHFRQIKEKLIETDPQFRLDLLNYFAYYLVEKKTEFEFNSVREYYDYIQSRKFLTLKGDYVKSFSELIIANELYIHDISYEYEKNYSYSTANQYHRNYKPDFYLTDPGIYIEFYGIDRGGNTAPFIDEARYNSDIAWKRDVHKTNGTTCWEFYTFQVTEKILLKELWRKLRQCGFQKKNVDVVRLVNELNTRGTFDEFSDLVSKFTKLFKEKGQSISGFKAAIGNNNRLSTFFSLYEKIYGLYQNELSQAGEVDFEDMIQKAVVYTSSGLYRSTFQFILVDEFQDISHNRAKLIKALVDNASGTKLFCVGDDWQSIYRFAGSDISVMTNFNELFGYHKTTELDKTFRYNNMILELSSKFAMLNENLIKKKLTANAKVQDKRVEISYYSDLVPDYTSIQLIHHNLSRIVMAASTDDIQSPSVYIIGRYNNLIDSKELNKLKQSYPSLDISYTTAHSSKGKESDYVIVIGLQNKVKGFPNRIQNDEIIESVLPNPELFPDAEEARLFYVAITRAKQRVYVLAHRESPSAFIDDIKKLEKYVLVSPGFGLMPLSHECPQCKDGKLVLRKNNNGTNSFYGCTLYPVCNYTKKPCGKCGVGLYLKVNDFISRCDNIQCCHEIEICPRCRDGHIEKRNRRDGSGSFFGCSNYSDATVQCTYTRNT